MHSVLIIGAGPIGLELATALKQGGVDYLHIDAGQVAQTIDWYPKQVRFFSSPPRIAISGVPLNVPDQAKASREQYLAYLRGVVEQFDLKVRCFERVTGIAPRDGDGSLTVHTEHRGEAKQYRARHVVLAIGDMHHPRKLNIPGEDLPHVSHYFDEPHRYFRQRLLIVGGRNSAVEAALRCHHAGAIVSLSYRGECFDDRSVKYWLLPEIKLLCKTGRIAFHPGTLPTAIDANSVTLRAVEDDTISRVEADFILLMTGYEQDRTLFESAGVELVGENRAPRVDEATMQTNVPGLYVAGTAAAGTQARFRLFIENCHDHVAKVYTAITGKPAPAYATNRTNAVLGREE